MAVRTHGVNTFEQASSTLTPRVAATGLPFVVGAAPIWQGTGTANTALVFTNYADAVKKVGYSDDWASYPLCEAIYTFFKLYGVGPMYACCPLDVSNSRFVEAVTAADRTVTSRTVKLPIEAIPSTVVVKSPVGAIAEAEYPIEDNKATIAGLNMTTTGLIVKTAAGTACTLSTDYTAAISGDMITITVLTGGQLVGETSLKATVSRASTQITYEEDEDYELVVNGEYLEIQAVSGGQLYGLYVDSINVGYSKAKTGAVTASDIIGGYNTTTGKNTGLECIEDCRPLYGSTPDLILCPGWSHDSEVAAVMKTKATTINGQYQAMALIDADCSASGADTYDKVYSWKNSHNITGEDQILLWPMGKLGSKKYHYSTQMAGLMAATDADNGGCPVRSPSNLSINLDTACNASGGEIIIHPDDAELLNTQGVVTMLPDGGMLSWGDWTACWPNNNDVKDYFISVRRMVKWIANTTINTVRKELDSPMNMLHINAIQNTLTNWLDGLKTKQQLIGYEVEFLESENPESQLSSGHIVFHVRVCPPSPMARIDFIFEYDSSMLSGLYSV